MHECSVHHDVSFVPHDQAAKVSEPGDQALDFPPTPVAPKRSSVLLRGTSAAATVGADDLDSTLGESVAQGGAVVSTIENETRRVAIGEGHRTGRRNNTIERDLQKLYLRRRGRGEVNSHRKTLAVSHHPPLCTFSTFGLTHAEAPFFAGAKLPSAKLSAQFMRPSSSSAATIARHAASQTPDSSHSPWRRRQVEGEGYASDRSFQRAPLRSTQRMPSNTSRQSARRRPPLGECRASGSNGSIKFQSSPVSSVLSLTIANFLRSGWPVNHKSMNGASSFRSRL